MSSGPLHQVDYKEFYEKNPDTKSYFKNHLINRYGGAWNFNEIKGYIRLHFLETQIRGEYWGVNAKRIIRTRKKIFEFKDWKLAPEIEIHPESDSMSIYSKILEYLDDCRKELKGRYIDMHNLITIGPYVDWKSLYNQNRIP
jgi:hypothetical protein